MLVAIFQPHTHTRYDVFDSLFFSCLGVVYILLPVRQSHKCTSSFYHWSSYVIVFICWKVLIRATKRYVGGGCGLTSYNYIYTKLFILFVIKLRLTVLSQLKEQEPLVDNNSKSNVLYTLDINNHWSRLHSELMIYQKEIVINFSYSRWFLWKVVNSTLSD
jgi:hypothetical protein